MFLVACQPLSVGGQLDDTGQPGGEVCNGQDDDGDGLIDEDLETSTWYRDGDGDGFGAAGSSVQLCAQPDGYVAQAGDCDDSQDQVHPGATEQCDGVDNDCDDRTDLVPAWFDDDGDGFTGTEIYVSACEDFPPDATTSPTDCDDLRDDVHPAADEVCFDGADTDCDGVISCMRIDFRDGGLECTLAWSLDDARQLSGVLAPDQDFVFEADFQPMADWGPSAACGQPLEYPGLDVVVRGASAWITEGPVMQGAWQGEVLTAGTEVLEFPDYPDYDEQWFIELALDEVAPLSD